MENHMEFTCSKCGQHNPQGLLSARLIPSRCTDEEIKKKFYPTWNVMIKQSCVYCGQYNKFIAQTSEIVEKFNEQQDNAFQILSELLHDRIDKNDEKD